MTALANPPVIPAHPNIVETVTLLEDPAIRTKDRTALQKVLHDTVHLVKRKDGSVQTIQPNQEDKYGRKIPRSGLLQKRSLAEI